MDRIIIHPDEFIARRTEINTAPDISSRKQDRDRIIIRSPFASTGAALLAEIGSYSDLQPGWDGPGSITPDSDALGHARAFVSILLSFGLPLPEGSPSGDGEVELFWKTRDSFIITNFKGNGKMAYYANIKNVVARDILPFEERSIPQDLLIAIRSI